MRSKIRLSIFPVFALAAQQFLIRLDECCIDPVGVMFGGDCSNQLAKWVNDGLVWRRVNHRELGSEMLRRFGQSSLT